MRTWQQIGHRIQATERFRQLSRKGAVAILEAIEATNQWLSEDNRLQVTLEEIARAIKPALHQAPAGAQLNLFGEAG